MSLTTSDMRQFQSILDKTLDIKLGKLEKKLNEKISHLPTKEQFYKKMDKWMKATTTHDLEQSAHKRAHERLDDHLASHTTL